MVDPDPVPALAPDALLPPAGSPIVDWITDRTRRDGTVISAIPLGFTRYATIVIPEDDAAKARADAALVGALRAHTAEQPWWLGYLDTGVADVVEPDRPRVAVYEAWPYVLLQGDPDQALGSRSSSGATPWHSALPELIFPADRSWLLSTLWDDDWRCVGGPAAMIDALLALSELEARSVTPEEDATPPGHDYG